MGAPIILDLLLYSPLYIWSSNPRVRAVEGKVQFFSIFNSELNFGILKMRISLYGGLLFLG